MSVFESLLDKIEGLTIIDAHAHLMPEAEYIFMPRDALRVYGQYVRFPMFASGLSSEEWSRLHDPAIPILQRWAILKPYLPLIRHTSFGRAARAVLRHFWDAEELSEDNVVPLSQRIAEETKPGIYQRVLRDHCGIANVFNQDAPGHDGHDHPSDLDVYHGQSILLPVVALIDIVPGSDREVHRLGGAYGFSRLSDYLEWARHRLVAMARAGAIAFKTFALKETEVDAQAAEQEFADLQRRGLPLRLSAASALRTYIQDELLSTVRTLGLPVAVHTGFFDVDAFHPAHLVPLLRRHPEVHFDAFHLGFPFGRDLIGVAATHANLSLNLCWAHSMNAAMTARGLDEAIDILGADKIIGFGSDVRWMVEKVFGHLQIARWNIARVLSARVENGWMDLAEAAELARLWLFGNPSRIYRLPKTLPVRAVAPCERSMAPVGT